MEESVSEDVRKGFQRHVFVRIVDRSRFEGVFQNLQIGSGFPRNDDLVDVDIDDESRVVFRPLKAVVQCSFLTEIMHFILAIFIRRNLHRNVPRNDLKNALVSIMPQDMGSVPAAGMIVNKKPLNAKHPVDFNPLDELLMRVVVQVERRQADCEVDFRQVIV